MKTLNTHNIRYPVRVQGPYQKNRGYEIADATGQEQIAADLTLPRAERIMLALNATRGMTDSDLVKMAVAAATVKIESAPGGDSHALDGGCTTRRDPHARQ